MSIPDSTLRQYIDTIFVKYDRDRSMTLDISELANFFNDASMTTWEIQGKLNEQQAYQALMMIDQNNDGRASKN